LDLRSGTANPGFPVHNSDSQQPTRTEPGCGEMGGDRCSAVPCQSCGKRSANTGRARFVNCGGPAAANWTIPGRSIRKKGRCEHRPFCLAILAGDSGRVGKIGEALQARYLGRRIRRRHIGRARLHLAGPWVRHVSRLNWAPNNQGPPRRCCRLLPTRPHEPILPCLSVQLFSQGKRNGPIVRHRKMALK